MEAEDFDHDVVVAGTPEGCLHNGVSFRAQFATNDEHTISKIKRFDRILDLLYPVHRAWWVDLETGEKIPDEILKQKSILVSGK